MPRARSVQDVESGALTYGHRFLATSGRAGRSIKVRSFEEYQARLSEHFVVLEHSERRDRIARDLDLHARRLGGRVPLKDHHALVEEVADLVEFPGVVAGFYPAGFLELPQEVLSTTLVHHQHYFPVVDETGKVKEAFLAVVNTRPADERLIAKNAERVVIGATERRQVLLGRRSEGDARIAARAPAHADLPQEARKLSRQGRADRAARAMDCRDGVRPRRCGGPCRDRCAAGEGGPRDRDGLRVPGAAGDDGRDLRPRGRPARAGVEGHLPSLPADCGRSGRPAVARSARAGGRRLGRDVAGGQARYRGGPHDCRRARDRLARSVRACAARCTASCAS